MRPDDCGAAHGVPLRAAGAARRSPSALESTRASREGLDVMGDLPHLVGRHASPDLGHRRAADPATPGGICPVPCVTTYAPSVRLAARWQTPIVHHSFDGCRSVARPVAVAFAQFPRTVPASRYGLPRGAGSSVMAIVSLAPRCASAATAFAGRRSRPGARACSKRRRRHAMRTGRPGSPLEVGRLGRKP